MPNSSKWGNPLALAYSFVNGVNIGGSVGTIFGITGNLWAATIPACAAFLSEAFSRYVFQGRDIRANSGESVPDSHTPYVQLNLHSSINANSSEQSDELESHPNLAWFAKLLYSLSEMTSKISNNTTYSMFFWQLTNSIKKSAPVPLTFDLSHVLGGILITLFESAFYPAGIMSAFKTIDRTAGIVVDSTPLLLLSPSRSRDYGSTTNSVSSQRVRYLSIIRSESGSEGGNDSEPKELLTVAVYNPSPASTQTTEIPESEPMDCFDIWGAISMGTRGYKLALQILSFIPIDILLEIPKSNLYIAFTALGSALSLYAIGINLVVAQLYDVRRSTLALRQLSNPNFQLPPPEEYPILAKQVWIQWVSKALATTANLNLIFLALFGDSSWRVVPLVPAFFILAAGTQRSEGISAKNLLFGEIPEGEKLSPYTLPDDRDKEFSSALEIYLQV